MPWETSPIPPSALENKEGGRGSKLKLHEATRDLKNTNSEGGHHKLTQRNHKLDEGLKQYILLN